MYIYNIAFVDDVSIDDMKQSWGTSLSKEKCN